MPPGNALLLILDFTGVVQKPSASENQKPWPDPNLPLLAPYKRSLTFSINLSPTERCIQKLRFSLRKILPDKIRGLLSYFHSRPRYWVRITPPPCTDISVRLGSIDILSIHLINPLLLLNFGSSDLALKGYPY